MAEPLDVIVPLLQRIQADISEIKREQSEHRTETASNTETMEAIQRYFYHQRGMTNRNEADIEAIQSQIKTLEAPLTALENRQ